MIEIISAHNSFSGIPRTSDIRDTGAMLEIKQKMGLYQQ